jgi:hypothetical protein
MCYAAVMIYNTDPADVATFQKFTLAPGYEPRKLPGNWAFGEVLGPGSYVKADSTYDATKLGNGGPENIYTFTTLTVVFSPSGQLVRKVNGKDIEFEFDTSTPTNTLFSGTTKIWDSSLVSPAKAGVAAVTMFDWSKVRFMDAAGRAAELSKSGQFLAVNVNTGQLVIRR